ncbi:hypothetical protein BDZ89DRAFT_1056849 [Hymenopellis radicata]|nr:hypothetical protein BDZ89DRAFT_1056849 [Hymenopellis radicata]
MTHRLFTFLLVAAAAYCVFRYNIVAKAFSLTQQTPLGQVPFIPVQDSYDDPRPYTRHIVAVGDLHGDFPNARKVLQFSGVIDDKGAWSGDVDYFVQTGDIIDRGDDTIKLFTFMDTLREQAQAKGGVVLSHLGNHEWMNVIGDWRYVYPSEIQTFGSVEARQKMISTGRIGRSWATNYTTASRLPLHPSLGLPNTPYPSSSSLSGPLSHSAISFVHGGLSPSYSGLSPFPSKINDLSDSLLRKLQTRKQPQPHPPGPYVGLPEDTTKEEAELYSSNGPLWYRGWAQDTEEKVCKDVEENITSRCGGKIIIIDTGISRAYGGVLSALSVHYTLEPIGKAEKPEEQEWEEREVVSALYADRQDVLSEDVRRVVGSFHLR